MKKQFLFTLFSIFFHTAIIGQDFKIKWSEEFKEEKGDRLENVMFDDGTNIYVQVANVEKGKGKDRGDLFTIPGIIKLDANLKPVIRENYTTDVEDMRLYGMFYVGGNFIMVTHKRTEGAKKNDPSVIKIYGLVINKETLKPVGSPVEIWEIINPPNISVKWNVTLSDDSTKIAFHSNALGSEKLPQKVAYKVVDKDLKTIHEKAEQLEYLNGEFVLNGIKVSKTGDFYRMAKVYSGIPKRDIVRDENRNKVAAYEILIQRYQPGGSFKEIKIPMGNKMLESFKMATHPITDNLFVFGVFESTSKDGITGNFIVEVDAKTGEVGALKVTMYEEEFIKNVNKICITGLGKKHEGILNDFQVIDFIVTPESRMYVILEERYFFAAASPLDPASTYFKNSLIVSELDKSGTEIWRKLIPKYQMQSVPGNAIGYSVFIYDNELTLFYNDESSNSDFNFNDPKKLPNMFQAKDDVSLMLVDFDDKGNFSRTEFLRDDGTNLHTFLDYSYQTKPTRFLIYRCDKKGKNNKLGIATVN